MKPSHGKLNFESDRQSFGGWDMSSEELSSRPPRPRASRRAITVPTSCACHIGRIGALAVALGIGTAVLTGGTAHADTGDAGSAKSSPGTSSDSRPASDRKSRSTRDSESDSPKPRTSVGTARADAVSAERNSLKKPGSEAGSPKPAIPHDSNPQNSLARNVSATSSQAPTSQLSEAPARSASAAPKTADNPGELAPACRCHLYRCCPGRLTHSR